LRPEEPGLWDTNADTTACAAEFAAASVLERAEVDVRTGDKDESNAGIDVDDVADCVDMFLFLFYLVLLCSFAKNYIIGKFIFLFILISKFS
jgi:hypothetical protein